MNAVEVPANRDGVALFSYNWDGRRARARESATTSTKENNFLPFVVGAYFLGKKTGVSSGGTTFKSYKTFKVAFVHFCRDTITRSHISEHFRCIDGVGHRH